MDLSSILKTVLSLADVIIKKPSTSVQNSGIDLSSIISIAGAMMGGNNNGNNSSGGGLGSILGSALGSGALGGLGSLLGGGSNQQQAQQQSSGGGMGDILGSVLGGMMGGGQQQAQESSGGGLGDLLGQLTSRAGTISNMLDTNNAQNLSSDEKNNLTDVLNIINATKMFAGK